MQIRRFTIPIHGGELLSEEMNVFLRSKKILQVREHLVNNNTEGIFWCYSVHYVDDVNIAERDKTYTNKYPWYLKLDVRKFFESVSHEVLVLQLARMFKDAAVVGIFEQIICSYEASPGRGLPIGNLTSQYFANHHLVGLDRLVKEGLRVPAYVRYMDDMVLWHPEKEALRTAKSAVADYLETELRLSLKPEALNRSSSGLPFLGYHIFPHHVRLLQKSKQRFVRKLRRIDEAYHSGEWSEARCGRRALPLLAFIGHADAKKLRESILLGLQGQSS